MVMVMKIRMRNEKRSGGFVKETFELFDMDCLKDQENGSFDDEEKER